MRVLVNGVGPGGAVLVPTMPTPGEDIPAVGGDERRDQSEAVDELGRPGALGGPLPLPGLLPGEPADGVQFVLVQVGEIQADRRRAGPGSGVEGVRGWGLGLVKNDGLL